MFSHGKWPFPMGKQVGHGQKSGHGQKIHWPWENLTVDKKMFLEMNFYIKWIPMKAMIL